MDGLDANQDPDLIPAAGFVTSTASVPYLPDPTASPNPATILTTSVVAVLDHEGYLCTPVEGTLDPSYRGVRLIATDDADILVTNWTWNATYSFSTLAIPTHSFAVPDDGVVDLTTVVRVPSSAGIGTEQAEALAASAQAAAIQSAQDAATAAQAAVDAAGAAQVTDANISALVANPASDTADAVTNLVDAAAADKLDVDDAINTYQSQAALDAAAAAKVNTDGTATNAAVKTIADAAAEPKLDAADLDAQSAALVDNVASSWWTAILAKLKTLFVGKGDLFTSATDAPYNADPTGVVDATAALNAASAAATAKGPNARLFIPAGNYKTTGTVTVACELDATQATINYYGTGTALVIGSESAPNIVTARQVYRAPRVINKNRGTTGWDGTSVGIRTVNLNTCELFVPFVQDFEKGLVMYGYTGGNAYNTVTLGALWENHKNLVLDTDTAGYTNQNMFLGGRLQHSLTKGATVDDVNAAQIYMATSFGGGPNNNTFINTSFEGDNVAYYRIDLSGKYNHFYNCRFEAPGGVPPRVRYRSTAQWNKIDGGYNIQSLVETSTGH